MLDYLIGTVLDERYIDVFGYWVKRMHRIFQLRMLTSLLLGPLCVQSRSHSPLALHSMINTAQSLNISYVIQTCERFNDFHQLSEFGKHLGRVDLAKFVFIHSQLSNTRAFVITELDIFWVKSPILFLQHVDKSSVICSANNLAHTHCNIGLMGFGYETRKAVKCFLKKWNSTPTDFGQTFFNKIFLNQHCKARVVVLKDDKFTMNRPASKKNIPNYNIHDTLPYSIHLTSMCWQKGCSEEVAGAKLSVLHALYHNGTWPHIKMTTSLTHNILIKKIFPNSSYQSSSSVSLRKPSLRSIWSLILFGFETTMLKLHLKTLCSVIDGFVIHESNITLQNTPKPLYLKKMILRNELSSNILSKIFPITSSPNECRKSRCIEQYQRQTLVKYLNTLKTSRDDLVLLGDVDEIAKPHILQQLRENWYDYDNYRGVILQGVAYIYGFHCRRKEMWLLGPRIYNIVNVMKENVDLNRLQFYKFKSIKNSSWHLSSFGSITDMKQKFQTWGHANMFSTSGSLNLSRLYLCAKNCMVPDAPSTKNKKLPSCESGSSDQFKLSNLPLDSPMYSSEKEFRVFFQFLK